MLRADTNFSSSVTRNVCYKTGLGLVLPLSLCDLYIRTAILVLIVISKIHHSIKSLQQPKQICMHQRPYLQCEKTLNFV